MRRVLVATLAVLLMGGCGNERPGGGRSGPLLPQDRLELPEFDLSSFRAMLAELRGTPVVVNIWGSWCPPCIVEAPDLAQVSTEFQGRVQFVGIDILDQRQAAREFIRRFDWQYPSVFDPTGAIRDGLGYVGQPVTLIYDRDGELSLEWNGATSADMLRREIREVL